MFRKPAETSEGLAVQVVFQRNVLLPRARLSVLRSVTPAAPSQFAGLGQYVTADRVSQRIAPGSVFWRGYRHSVQATASSCQALCPSCGFAPCITVERICGSLY